MKLAKYGRDELIVAFLALGIIGTVLWLFVLPLLVIVPGVVLAIIIWFFRDPERNIPVDENAIISPADGLVMDIEELEEPMFVKQKAVRVGIFMSPFDVHLTRVPDSGRISFLYYSPGKFLSAFKPKAKTDNENNSIGLFLKRAGKEIPVLIRQISGVLARRIVCECNLEDEVVRGQRIGMIKFGSRTEVYLPVSSKPEIKVKVGDKVRGGETVVAELK